VSPIVSALVKGCCYISAAPSHLQRDTSDLLLRGVTLQKTLTFTDTMRFKFCISLLLLLLQNKWVHSEEEVWSWDIDRQDNGRNIFLGHKDYSDSYHAAASDLSEVVIFPSDDEVDVMVFPDEEITAEDEGSREGRFLGIGKGIRCSLGIGPNCDNNRKVQKPNGHHHLNSRPKPQSSFFPSENTQDHHAHSPHRFGSPATSTHRPSSGILDSISSAFSSIIPSIGHQKPKPLEADRAYTTIKHHPYKIPQPSFSNPKPSFSSHKPTFAHPKPSFSAHKPTFTHPKPVYPPKPAHPSKHVFKPSYHEPKPSYNVVKPVYADPKVTVFRQPTYTVQPTYVQAQVQHAPIQIQQQPHTYIAAAPAQVQHAPIQIQQQPHTYIAAAPAQVQHAPIQIQQQPHTYIAAVPVVQAAPVFQPAPVTVTQTVTRVASVAPVISNRNDAFVSSGHEAQHFLQQSHGNEDLLSQATLYRETIEYREDCHCVTYDSCSLNDVIGRNLQVDPSNVIDARNSEKNNIESNATETDTTETRNATQEYEFSEVKENSTILESNNTRRKRSEDEIVESFDTQGRQLTGFTPDKFGCGDGYVCCRRPVYRPEPRYQCGQSNSRGLLGRVSNYEEGDTEFGEYPWQAAILKRENNAVNYVCGAVLIDDRHVLTAAHCVDGLLAANLKVRVGEWDVANKDEFYNHIELQVSQLYINQQYTKGTLENDLAMLRLSSNVDFTSNPHIGPVCLPDKFTGFRQNGCMVTGWGKDAFDTTGKFQHILKKVALPLVEHHQCQNALRSTRLGPSYSLHEGMMCAGGEESKDACKGDGGSPLACKSQDGSYQLAGIVSWGIGCGQRGIPGVYVNIRYYLDWINSIQDYN
ncbi:unnamed protein product, partial [Meganyctiphanes norvegica]